MAAWLAFPRHEIERLGRDAQAVVALHRVVQITVDRRANGLGPGCVGGGCQFVLDREQYLQTVARDDWLWDAVVVEGPGLSDEKRTAIINPPARQFVTGPHVFAVAPDEQRQLQCRPRPQIEPILADVAAGIGKGQRMREVEPADIVGDRVAVARSKVVSKCSRLNAAAPSSAS